MPDVELEIRHGLGQDEATARLERLLTSQASASGFVKDAAISRRGAAISFSARIKEIGVKGEITVSGEKVRVSVKVPWAAWPFRAQARDYVREYLAASLL